MPGSSQRDLADALVHVVEADNPTEQLLQEQALLTLEQVVQLLPDDDELGPTEQLKRLEVALLTELREAASSLEEQPSRLPPNRATASLVALGIAPGSIGLPFRGGRAGRGRLPMIAEQLARSEETLTRGNLAGLHQLLGALAHALHIRETAAIAARLKAQQRQRRRPEQTALGIPWLDRFEAYYRIWSTLGAVEDDITLALLAAREGDSEDQQAFERNSFHFFVAYLHELNSFERDRGGLWILVDAAREQRVANIVYFVVQSAPFGQLDLSMLRTSTRRSPELVEIAELVQSGAPLVSCFAKWTTWLQACTCADPRHEVLETEEPAPPDGSPYPGFPNLQCGPGRIVVSVRQLIKDINEDWDALADWYSVRDVAEIDPAKSAKAWE